MLTVGILGGIASGKTFVAEQLENLGARRIDADQIAHSVLRDAEVRSALADRWGRAVLDESGEIDRSAVAEIVFAGGPQATRELEFLEQVTHPRIAERIRTQLRSCRQRGPNAGTGVGQGADVAVLDAAVLLKAGWNHLCDKILFVEVPREKRLERAVARGWSKEEFAAREAAQESLDEKRSAADWVIDNSGTPGRTLSQVHDFWRTLHAKPSASGDH